MRNHETGLSITQFHVFHSFNAVGTVFATVYSLFVVDNRFNKSSYLIKLTNLYLDKLSFHEIYHYREDLNYFGTPNETEGLVYST